MSGLLLERDWRFITDSLLYIYSTESINELEHESLARLQSIIPAEQHMFTLFDFDGATPNQTSSVVTIGEPARYIEQFLAVDYDSDPYFRSWNLFKTTKVFRDTDMMPDDYRENTPLYREIYEKQGIHYALRAYLVHNNTTVGNISIFRHRDGEDFSDRDMEVLEVFAPHIAQHLYSIRYLRHETEASVANTKLAQYHLTAKEQEVVEMILSNMSDGDIAEALVISRATLKTHVYNIYRKTGVKNRVQLFSLLS